MGRCGAASPEGSEPLQLVSSASQPGGRSVRASGVLGYESDEAVALIVMRSDCVSDWLLYYFYKSTRKGKKKRSFGNAETPLAMRKRRVGGLRAANLVAATVCVAPGNRAGPRLRHSRATDLQGVSGPDPPQNQQPTLSGGWGSAAALTGTGGT